MRMSASFVLDVMRGIEISTHDDQWQIRWEHLRRLIENAAKEDLPLRESTMLDPEMVKLIPRADLSSSEKFDAFKKWQYEDGTLDGLKNLISKQNEAGALRKLVTCP